MRDNFLFNQKAKKKEKALLCGMIGWNSLNSTLLWVRRPATERRGFAIFDSIVTKNVSFWQYDWLQNKIAMRGSKLTFLESSKPTLRNQTKTSLRRQHLNELWKPGVKERMSAACSEPDSLFILASELRSSRRELFSFFSDSRVGQEPAFLSRRAHLPSSNAPNSAISQVVAKRIRCQQHWMGVPPIARAK